MPLSFAFMVSGEQLLRIVVLIAAFSTTMLNKHANLLKRGYSEGPSCLLFGIFVICFFFFFLFFTAYFFSVTLHLYIYLSIEEASGLLIWLTCSKKKVKTLGYDDLNRCK